MFSTDGGEKDPVRLFKVCLSKRSERMKDNGPLYLSVIHQSINEFYLKSKHASLAQLKADLQEGRDIYNSRIWNII